MRTILAIVIKADASQCKLVENQILINSFTAAVIKVILYVHVIRKECEKLCFSLHFVVAIRKVGSRMFFCFHLTHWHCVCLNTVLFTQVAQPSQSAEQ